MEFSYVEIKKVQVRQEVDGQGSESGKIIENSFNYVNERRNNSDVERGLQQ